MVGRYGTDSGMSVHSYNALSASRKPIPLRDDWKLTPWRSGDGHVYEIFSAEPLFGPNVTHRLVAETFGHVLPAEMFLCALGGEQVTTVVRQPFTGSLSHFGQARVTASWCPQLAIEVRHAGHWPSAAVRKRRVKRPPFGTITPEHEMARVRACFNCLPAVLAGYADGFYSVTYPPVCDRCGPRQGR